MTGGARVVSSILELVGNTPSVELRRVTDGAPYRLLAKLEFLNPGGSVKDRIAARMVEAAEKDGRLAPGGTIVEATSGNTGVGLALLAAVRGYRIVFVIPDKMSTEKIRLLRAYGARVVVTPAGVPPDHPMSHYSVARRLAKEIPGAYYPNQYENPGNAESHYLSTGPEIAAVLGDGPAAVVGTVGTGGTLSGVGRYFKEHRPDVKIVAVDPIGSVLAPYFRTQKLGPASPYLVEGIGEDMVPKSIDLRYFDEFVQVGDRESFAMARRLAREEGLFVGGSAGSAVAGALGWLARRPLPDGSTVVVILPDSGDRYLSKFYSDDWMVEKGFLDAGTTARGLVERKRRTPALVAVEPTTTAREALAILARHDFDLLPVLEGDANVGTVHAEELLRRSLDDSTVLDRSVRANVAPPMSELLSDASLADLLRTFREERAVLVRDVTTHRPVGVLTRADVVAFLSEEERSHAV